MLWIDNDFWVIIESVGVIVLGVVVVCVVEIESDNLLINDLFVWIFVDVVGDGIWSMYMNCMLLVGVIDFDLDLWVLI